MSQRNKSVRLAEPPAVKDCKALIEVLSRIGDKWTIVVVGALAKGPQRYSAIQRFTEGISQRMLTLTLKGLVTDGLIARTVYPTNPPRVDYELTDLGKTLLKPLLALTDWASLHLPEIEKARAAHKASGSR